MKQYNNVNSGELKALSSLLTELMVLPDSLQTSRLQFVVEGDQNTDGLLTLVKVREINSSIISTTNTFLA